MYLRTKMMFAKWALMFMAVGIMGGTFIYWTLPPNMEKLDLHKDETVVNAPYYDYQPPPP